MLIIISQFCHPMLFPARGCSYFAVAHIQEITSYVTTAMGCADRMRLVETIVCVSRFNNN